MEERKKREIAYYDEAAERLRAEKGDFEGFSPLALSSYRFLYKVAGPLCAGKKVLDYGCGNGVHAAFLAKHASEVVGVDLSEGALEVARKRYPSTSLRAGKIQFLKMDCEAMEFADHSFDVVFDGGTFSSLDFEKALAEITRVLRPNGVLVGIETFGHNPFANAKRVLNRITGKRTAWAASHIVTKREIEILRQSFGQVEVCYFHLISLFAFPFVSLPGGKFVLELAQLLDKLVFAIPLFRTYAFKVVFVAGDVKKNI